MSAWLRSSEDPEDYRLTSKQNLLRLRPSLILGDGRAEMLDVRSGRAWKGDSAKAWFRRARPQSETGPWGPQMENHECAMYGLRYRGQAGGNDQ